MCYSKPTSSVIAVFQSAILDLLAIIGDQENPGNICFVLLRLAILNNL